MCAQIEYAVCEHTPTTCDEDTLGAGDEGAARITDCKAFKGLGVAACVFAFFAATSSTAWVAGFLPLEHAAPLGTMGLTALFTLVQFAHYLNRFWSDDWKGLWSLEDNPDKDADQGHEHGSSFILFVVSFVLSLIATGLIARNRESGEQGAFFA